jgi:hypothetical protein
VSEPTIASRPERRVTAWSRAGLAGTAEHLVVVAFLECGHSVDLKTEARTARCPHPACSIPPAPLRDHSPAGRAMLGRATAKAAGATERNYSDP